jgi:pimeloyl-ACP methyl ester carboxylesterase
MSDFILIPGAWMGSWAWEPVARGLRALGHRAPPITLSGLTGDAASAAVGLATHVDDVLALLDTGDLRDVVVVGHSYSGIVAGQVADRAPERVAHTVYVAAFLPRDGASLLDAFGERQRADELGQIAAHRGRWPAPRLTAENGQDLSAEQIRWLMDRFAAHPGRTVAEPAVLRRPLAEQRATYIACTLEDDPLPDDVAALREAPNWTFRTLHSGHWPMVSAPDALVALLAEVAAERG